MSRPAPVDAYLVAVGKYQVRDGGRWLALRPGIRWALGGID